MIRLLADGPPLTDDAMSAIEATPAYAEMELLAADGEDSPVYVESLGLPPGYVSEHVLNEKKKKNKRKAAADVPWAEHLYRQMEGGGNDVPDGAVVFANVDAMIRGVASMYAHAASLGYEDENEEDGVPQLQQQRRRALDVAIRRVMDTLAMRETMECCMELAV